MDIHTAMEESYKNGYRKGFEDGCIQFRHGTGENAWAECSECHVCGSPAWKVCPVCETRMEVSNGKE